jgi:hypothetical protein
LALDDHSNKRIHVVSGDDEGVLSDGDQGVLPADDEGAPTHGHEGVSSERKERAATPRAGELFRRGAVYALAGVLRATDVGVAAARGAVRGAKEGADEARGDKTRARA